MKIQVKRLQSALLSIGLAAGIVAAGCSSHKNAVATAAPAPVTSGNALFQVGAAVVSIDPTAPVFAGGNANPSDQAIQVSNDPLQARAFVIANGTNAVAFVVVDSMGWFADYQDQNAGNGQVGARVDAAKALAALGYSADRSAVMVSTTHSHATPTMLGIWGLMGTNNQQYVKQVHDAVVAAVTQAASNLKTSELWYANGDISSIIWQNGQGTDHVDGFAVDAHMPVLWARDPVTGATNAMYVNIPNHPDEFSAFAGTTVVGFSADVPGYVRKTMDSTVGGVAVVGSGTLGRQESPGQDRSYAEVGFQGQYVASALRLAMIKAQPLKADTLASAETMINASVGSTAGNQGLLSLMKYNSSNGPFGGPSCDKSLGGNCTIPRSLTAPYCNGNCTLSGSGSTQLGTYVTAIRIGDLLYVSNPGESFAEVNNAISQSVQGAQSVNAVGLAGDFLGYNWQPSDYTPTQFGSSDFAKYNVGPDLAQATAQGGYINAAAVGFKVTDAPVSVKAVSDTTVATLPGVQFYPSTVESTPADISFYGSSAQPQVNYQKTNDTLSQISWDFGDGTTSQTNGGTRFTHTYAKPGVYTVIASVQDMTTNGSRYWTQYVTIDEPLTVKIATTAGNHGVHQLMASAIGGQGTLIAANWTCTDGTTASGLAVTCPAGAGNVQVSAVDGAGNSAQATLAVH